MNCDAVWQTFTDTGDPMGYLLFRAATGMTDNEKNRQDCGEIPRPAD